MPFEFKFPDVGEGIEEGEIVKWFVKVGDSVKENQTLGQIETDKAVVDMPSPVSGKILKINFKEGDKVRVGEIMVVIGEKGEKISKANNAKEEKKKKRKSGSVVGEIDDRVSNLEYEHIEMKQADVMKGLRVNVPSVRKMSLKRDDIPQQTIIVKKKFDDYGYIERVPLKGIRKTIAEHMSQSVREAPQVSAMEDIDVSVLWKFRESMKNTWAKKGVKLTFLPFIVKAVISALQENPILNSSIEGEEIIIKKYYNIGIATETEVGLMVPVIKIAQNKSIIQIAKEIVELSDKARTRKIDVMDLKGGTFTITNYGSVGGTYAVPIINYPEAAILGLGRIFDRVVLDEKSGKVRNIKILPASLTFDHRILDGAQGARFLESLKKFLEEPRDLLKEMK